MTMSPGREHVQRQQIQIERLRIFFDASRRTAWLAFLLGILCVLALQGAMHNAVLLGWLLVLLACYAVRASLYACALTAQVTDRQLKDFNRRAILGAALTGSAWGLLAVLPLPAERFDCLLFLSFVIGGVTASATPSLGAHDRAAYAFVLPCVLPLSARMLLHISPLGLITGAMILLYLGVVYVTVQRIARGLEKAVQLRIDADERGAALDQSRSELQRHQRLMAIAGEAQSAFIRGQEPVVLMRKVLVDLLELTGMQLAVVVEAEAPDRALTPLKVHSTRDNDASELQAASEELCRSMVEELRAATLMDPEHASSPMQRTLSGYVALPLQVGGTAVGTMGLSGDRVVPEAAFVAYLQPLATTLGHLLLAMRADQQRCETERRLERTRSQLQICVTDTPAAVAMLDRELRVIACSQRWLSDFGVMAEHVEGRALYEIVPEIPLRWRESFARVLTGQLEINEEDPFVRGDGTVRWLRWQSRPWYEHDGSVAGLVLFSEDVTARKKVSDTLHARERLLEQLTDRVPGLLFQMRQRADGQRSLLYVSSGSLRVLRMTPDVLIENPARIFDICHPADRAGLDAALAKADVTGLLQAAFRTQCANGEVRWLSLQADATRLADASSVWHGYIEDVTEHVSLQSRLIRRMASGSMVATADCTVEMSIEQSAAMNLEAAP